MSIQSWFFERASLRKPFQTLGRKQKLSCSDCSCVLCFLLSGKLLVMNAYAWKLLGQVFFYRYTLEGSNGLTSICPSRVNFLSVHPWENLFRPCMFKMILLRHFLSWPCRWNCTLKTTMVKQTIIASYSNEPKIEDNPKGNSWHESWEKPSTKYWYTCLMLSK